MRFLCGASSLVVVLLTACASPMSDKYPYASGWQRLQYAGPAESLGAATPILRDCREATGTGESGSSRFVVLKDRIAQSRFVRVLHYWVVPAPAAQTFKEGDYVYANGRGCRMLVVSERGSL